MSEDEMNAVESALRGLTPTPQPLNRDALMYQAGRTSAAPRPWLWQAATAAAMLCAVGIGIAFWMRPAEVRRVERIVYLPAPPPAPAPTPPVEPPSPGSRPTTSLIASPWEPPASRYEQVRDNVLRWGLDGLPPAPKTRHDPISADQLVHPF